MELLSIKNDFGKKFHLLSPAQFKTVYDTKRWVANREFSCNFTANDLDIPRLGLVVSKKVSKKAVDRNAIKRSIREWFRYNKESFGNLDLVISARPSAKNLNTEQINKSLFDLWNKAAKRNVN